MDSLPAELVLFLLVDAHPQQRQLQNLRVVVQFALLLGLHAQ